MSDTPDLNYLALDWANKKLTTKEMLEAAYQRGYADSEREALADAAAVGRRMTSSLRWPDD